LHINKGLMSNSLKFGFLSGTNAPKYHSRIQWSVGMLARGMHIKANFHDRGFRPPLPLRRPEPTPHSQNTVT
jgi:hypothetical protein